VYVVYVAGISTDVALTVTENSVGIRRVQAQMEELEKKMTDMHNMIKTAVLGLFSLYLHPGSIVYECDLYVFCMYTKYPHEHQMMYVYEIPCMYTKYPHEHQMIFFSFIFLSSSLHVCLHGRYVSTFFLGPLRK